MENNTQEHYENLFSLFPDSVASGLDTYRELAKNIPEGMTDIVVNRLKNVRFADDINYHQVLVIVFWSVIPTTSEIIDLLKDCDLIVVNENRIEWSSHACDFLAANPSIIKI